MGPLEQPHGGVAAWLDTCHVNLNRVLKGAACNRSSVFVACPSPPARGPERAPPQTELLEKGASNLDERWEEGA